MENPSHPVSKKPYNANGFGPKTVYDDVFGGPSKFGVPTLSPRVEDYAEIFGNFNGCRSSSIPILELPAAVDEVDLSFDFPKSKLDYSEVFGGFNGLGFATSFDQFYNDPKPAYDSSDEAWTPAESGSLSDESEPSACSERNRSLINEEPFQSSDSITQFNISYNKASRRNKEDLSNGMAHTTQVHAVPGFSYIVDETIYPKKTQSGDSLLRVADHLIPNVEINKGLREKKQLRKATSEISNSSFCKQASRQAFTADCMDESFLSLSDINLRTRPSELPPPSRPPPPLARAGDSDQQKSKLEASKSFAYGETKGDNSPPFFDVEIDARSSAAVSDAAMRDAMEMAKAKLKSAKESQAKKLSRKCTADMDLGVEVGKESKPFNESNCIKDEKHHGTFTGVERLKGARAAHVFSDANEGGSNKNLTEVCAEKKNGKACRSSLESYQTEGTVAWREESNFFEVVKTDKSQQIFDQSKDENSHANNIEVRRDGLGKKATTSFQRKEDEDYREIEGLNHERNENKRRVGKNQQSVRHEELENNLKLNPEEKKNKPRMTKQQTDREKIPSSSDTNEEWENLEGIQMKGNEVKVEKKSKKRTGDKKHHDAHVREEKARRPRESLEGEGYEKRMERSIEQAKIDKGLNRSLDHKELEKEGREARERIEKEKKQEPCKTVENEKIPGHALKDEENDGLRVSLEQDEAERKLRISVERGEEKHHKDGQNEMRLLQETRRKEKKVGACLQKEEISGKQMDAVKGEETPEIQSCSCRREEKVEEPVEVLQQNENHEREESVKEDMKQREGEMCSQESAECEATQKTDEDVEYGNESEGCSHYHDQDVTDEVERKVNSTDGFCVASEDLNVSNGSCEVDDNMNLHAGEADCKDKENGVEVKTTRTAFSFSGDRTMRDEPMGSKGQVEALQKVNVLSEEQFASSGSSPDDSLHSKEQVRMRDSNESFNAQYTGRDSDKAGVVKGQMPMDANKVSSNLGKPNGLTHELGVKVGASVREAEVQFDEEVRKSKVFPSQVVRKLGEDKEKMGAHQSAGLEKKPNGQKIRTTQKVSKNQEPERKEKNLTPEDREKEERLKREKEREEDRLRKIEEEREREKEREKDRMAVDRATLEASEKAFGETRERSSVGRVTAEVRQRMMAEARERLEKASAEARERLSGDKVSTESRLRAERGAVERATAEARERAFQKAMVEKATIEARERAGNLNADKFSSAYKSGGMRNDPHDMQSQSVGPNTSYVYSSIHGGAEGESPQRCKARLERHQRTAERAAKALAEKNMRDLLAQREQAERNRFAEYLDVEVKRWSSGKEGNLRALVSTLQYILGPESGWQPIPLTEVITSAAVKKAYRKATLCVHPDKLQQRGASIQHKYICEKVFDLLKEAWNRFNSEER